MKTVRDRISLIINLNSSHQNTQELVEIIHETKPVFSSVIDENFSVKISLNFFNRMKNVSL